MTLRILLVEDNALNSELASDLLGLAGHEVDVAATGAQLRARLTDGPTPDIVLMDILLPDADGVSLLSELRAVARFGPVPVVALTAQALTGDEAHMLAAGFAAVITKPIDTRTFAAEVAALATRAPRRPQQPT